MNNDDDLDGSHGRAERRLWCIVAALTIIALCLEGYFDIM